jgi:hypothetical protein
MHRLGVVGLPQLRFGEVAELTSMQEANCLLLLAAEVSPASGLERDSTIWLDTASGLDKLNRTVQLWIGRFEHEVQE